jgi:hypothetical protein
MNNYLVPVNEEYIEYIAKAIARDRFYRDVEGSMQEMRGMKGVSESQLEQAFEEAFDRVWFGGNIQDERSKQNYRMAATSAIRAINLKLLISEK